ncbi:hypothetical protein KKI23_00130 [Patescibacteria group bacterium]|nr:hypothetical protein [Patescibacteria group bacterium]
MTNQIDQIKQAEKEAEGIVVSAHTEVKQKTAEVRSSGEEAIIQSSTRLKPEMDAITKQAETTIKSSQDQIESEAQQEIAKLSKVNQSNLDKAVDLIVTQTTKH